MNALTAADLGMRPEAFEQKMGLYVAKYFQTEQYYQVEDAAQLGALSLILPSMLH